MGLVIEHSDFYCPVCGCRWFRTTKHGTAVPSGEWERQCKGCGHKAPLKETEFKFVSQMVVAVAGKPDATGHAHSAKALELMAIRNPCLSYKDGTLYLLFPSSQSCQKPKIGTVKPENLEDDWRPESNL